MKKYHLISIFISIVLILSFQNCSDTKFKKGPTPQEVSSIAPEQEPEQVSEDIQQGVISTGLKDITAFVGDDVTFQIAATSFDNSPLTFQWSGNSVLLTGQTESVLNISNVQIADSGTYRVDIFNTPKTGLAQDSQSAVLNVLLCNPDSKSSCSVSYGSGQKICASDGKSQGACVATGCNSGYQLSNDACQIILAKTATCSSWLNIYATEILYFFGKGKSQATCQSLCVNWYIANKKPTPGGIFTCARHINGDCHGAVAGNARKSGNLGCSGCRSSICTAK
ncbi:hypothetical protein COB52_05025 [Candidatus Kaiserbacteria bacterium]|nr:MAG: hypothetical protein COB52_05025 [Candidatus Kaiserbacteria bacterium]